MTSIRHPSAAALLCLVALFSGCGTGRSTGPGPGTDPSPPVVAGSSGDPTAAAGATTSAPGAASSAAPVPVESNPPGDIPDNLAFVRYTSAAGHYAFTHPEGWARVGHGTQVQFTEKLNGVAVQSEAATRAPTTATARSEEVPRIQAGVPAFELRTISAVTLPAGPGVRIVFRRNSDPDPVTGKQYRDEVERYLVSGQRWLVRMDLSGPVGADNVDAYRTMAQSLVIR